MLLKHSCINEEMKAELIFFPRKISEKSLMLKGRL